MTKLFVLLGGLGIFLYGLRIMSEALQQFAGERLRTMLASITRNRISGVVSGVTITSIIQSSSATTVLIVAFANAGLLTLVQAIGPVMGANIGTTITAWLVALLGFKVKITAFALPVIAIGFPLTFLCSHKAKNAGVVLIGFGLLFLGLDFMKSAVPGLKSDPGALAFLQGWATHGYWSILLFVIVGTALTIVLQSSSATMAVTMIMANQGWIGFEVACAMVLGENIGTTITANIAALGANRTAKRVARVHFVFNIIGVLWVLPVILLVLRGIDAVVPGDPYADASVIKDHLAAFHTIFNITNTLLLIWFVPQLAALAHRMVPPGPDEDLPRLKVLDPTVPATTEIALVELRAALLRMLDEVRGAFGILRGSLAGGDAAMVDAVYAKEQRTDAIEQEIVEFCADLARVGGSEALGRAITSSIEVAHQIERMGDHCLALAYLSRRIHDKKWAVSETATSDLAEMAGLAQAMLDIAAERLAPNAAADLDAARRSEEALDLLQDKARKRTSKEMEEGNIPVRQGVVFIDMHDLIERVGDRCTAVMRWSKTYT